MMSASCGAKTASIRKVVCELTDRPDWNVDRQTDGFSALYNYRYLRYVYNLIVACDFCNITYTTIYESLIIVNRTTVGEVCILLRCNIAAP